jgi:hypothetical protein
MKLPSSKTQLWIPSLVAAFISLLVIGPVFAGIKLSESPGLPAFYGFVPFVFGLVALVTYRYIARLETRLEMLERRLSDRSG